MCCACAAYENLLHLLFEQLLQVVTFIQSILHHIFLSQYHVAMIRAFVHSLLLIEIWSSRSSMQLTTAPSFRGEKLQMNKVDLTGTLASAVRSI